MTNDFDNEPLDDFERQLAIFRPRAIRIVTFKTTARNSATKRTPPDWMRYAAVGLSCFALGAGVMYGMLNFQPSHRETPPPPPPGYALLPVFGDAEIAKLRRPIDAMRLTMARPQQPVPEQPIRNSSLYMLQRNIMNDSAPSIPTNNHDTE